jgi:hypothetical protein
MSDDKESKTRVEQGKMRERMCPREKIGESQLIDAEPSDAGRSSLLEQHSGVRSPNRRGDMASIAPFGCSAPENWWADRKRSI